MNFHQAFFDELTKAAFALGEKERKARDEVNEAYRKAYSDEGDKTLNEKRKGHRNVTLKRSLGGMAGGALGGAAIGALLSQRNRIAGAGIGASIGAFPGLLGGTLSSRHSFQASNMRDKEWRRRKKEMGEDAFDQG